MTTHRRLPALATVGILLLSACGAPDPSSPEGAGATATSSAAPDLERDPHPVDAAIPEATTDGLWLPLPVADARIVDPGWGTDVHYADGVFLGVADQGNQLTYTAVDVHGEALWQAQRPDGSTDFGIRSDEQGRSLAVLPDRAPDGTTTVTGYDLTTGEQVWGPAEPPGPGTPERSGPAPDGEGGELHEDPTTRTVIALTDTTLHAEDPDGAELWSLSITQDTRVVGLSGGLLYLREGDAIRAHNVVTGAVAQAYDPEGQGRVVVPRMMVNRGATLLIDGDRTLIATAPDAPPAPGG